MNTTVLKLDWTINQFQSHTVQGKYIDSPYFEPSNEHKISLNLYPNGSPWNTTTNDVKIFMCFDEFDDDDDFCEMNVLYKFSLINSHGQHVHKIENKFNCREVDFELPEYIRRTYILERAGELLPDGILRIYCELHISPIAIQPKPLPLHMDNKLLDDYTKMLESSKFHDVILRFGDKELKAHKIILSARSPVFEAMFSHDLEENRQNRVNIEDVSVEVFEVLLKYIYTGQVELDETFAADLLVASDKYGFENLKCQCEQWICCKLENDQTQSYVSSIVDLLVMADMQSAKLLKIESIKYFVRNSNLIITADKWAKLMQIKPKLFNEIFKLMAKKLNDLNALDDLEID